MRAEVGLVERNQPSPNDKAGSQLGSRRKTLVGVLASHEDARRHDELVELFDDLVASDLKLPPNSQVLPNFAFVFTGGTFKRIIKGHSCPGKANKTRVKDQTRTFLLDRCQVIRLPSHEQGGVVLLAYLMVERRVNILWPFFTPVTSHWLQAENAALIRLSDHWRVNRLLNAHSIRQWFPSEAMARGVNRDPQSWPPEPLQIGSLDSSVPGPPEDLEFGLDHPFALADEREGPDDSVPLGRTFRIPIPPPKQLAQRTPPNLRIALISHDEMKDRMAEFVSDYHAQFRSHFGRIVTTATTGRMLREASPGLARKIYAYHSGPKGGDIQIATEIILGLIDVVVFFVDPLRAHPHIDDIRVLFGACMLQPVRMLTNERQAREWMDDLALLPFTEPSDSGGLPRGVPAAMADRLVEGAE